MHSESAASPTPGTTPPDMRLGRAVTPRDVAACLAIRREVFIRGQGVPEALEVDGLDGEAIHYCGWLDDRPVATARVRIVPRAGIATPLGGTGRNALAAKVQRVAVIAAERGRGCGARLMRFVEHDLARSPEARGVALLTLGSQETAVPFYAALGYTVRGERFMEAGIPHRTMERPLAREPDDVASRAPARPPSDRPV